MLKNLGHIEIDEAGIQDIHKSLRALLARGRKYIDAPERLRSFASRTLRRKKGLSGKRGVEREMMRSERAGRRMDQAQSIEEQRGRLKTAGKVVAGSAAVGVAGFEAGRRHSPHLQYEDIQAAVREMNRPRLRKRLLQGAKRVLSRAQRMYEMPERIRAHQLKLASKGKTSQIKNWEKKRQRMQTLRTAAELSGVGASAGGLGYKLSSDKRKKRIGKRDDIPELSIRDINRKKRLAAMSEKERRKLFREEQLKRKGIRTFRQLQDRLRYEKETD